LMGVQDRDRMEDFEEISEAADEGGDAAPTGGKGTRPTRSSSLLPATAVYIPVSTE